MTPQEAQQQIFVAFSQNRSLVEKWLAYPRHLQQEYGINPVLAGGCIRDILLGQEPRDLDVFISASNWRVNEYGSEVDTAEAFLGMADREGWSRLEGTGIPCEYTLVMDITSVWDFADDKVEQPYQFIFMQEDMSSADVINRFDFGINMVGVNTYGQLAISQHFIDDMVNQRITIRNERSREVTLERYERLSKKYPGPLVTAEGLEIEKPHAGIILP